MKIKSLTLFFALLMVSAVFAFPADAQTYYSCQADCRNCSGQAPFDCFTNGCWAVGETVECASGCCLWSDMGYCASLSNPPLGFVFYTLQCGIRDPGGWLQSGENTTKSASPTCLDLGVNPEARPDHRPNWLILETDGQLNLRAEDIRIAAASPGIQKAMGDLTPERLAEKVNILEENLFAKHGQTTDETLLVAIYPSEQATEANLDGSGLYKRAVPGQQGKATFEVAFDRAGRAASVQAVHWTSKELAAAVLPMVQEHTGIVLTKGKRGNASGYYALVTVTVLDGEINSLLSNAFTMP